MNDQHTDQAPDLPELSDETIERLERGVFDDIARDRAGDRRRSRRRRRWVGGSLGVAAAVAACLVAVPLIGQGIGGGDVASDAGPQYMPDGAAVEDGAASGSGGSGSSGAEEDSAVDGAQGDGSGDSSVGGALHPDYADANRMIIRTATATVIVDDVLAATDELGDLADAHHGYVEAMGTGGGRDDDATYGWVSLRIPSDELDAARKTLTGLGDVTSVEVSEDDVTSQAIDLKARIDALEASVDRLTELMAKAGSVGDLLEAEQALSDRQADLEAYQRELDHLSDQVSMSTLRVDLTTSNSAASADPAGFGDGFLSGWNGLIAFANGLVVAVGFLLPWVGALVVAWLVVWGIIRIVRRRRRRRAAP